VRKKYCALLELMETDREHELAELREAVSKLHWIFAKTLAHIPHWYIVRGRTCPEDVYARLFNGIRTYGVAMRFGPYRNRYLFLGDGFKCWAMTSQLRASRIINRDSVLDPADWPGSVPDGCKTAAKIP
jgi:hypothetical protein